MKWSNFAYDDSRTVVKKLGLEITKAASRDEVYWYSLDGQKQLRIILPNNHGGAGALSTGFIKQIMMGLKLNAREFERLVECSLSASVYETMIRDKLKLPSPKK